MQRSTADRSAGTSDHTASDPFELKPTVEIGPLQTWLNRAVAAPGVAAVRATVDLTNLANEVILSAGSTQQFKRADGNNRRRPWGRDQRPLDRRERAVVDAEGRWLGTLTVEFAEREPGLDATLADLLTESLLATLVSSLMVEAVRHYRTRSFQVREALNDSIRGFDLAFEESVIGLALVPLVSEDAGRLVRVNDRLCQLTGFDRPTLLSRNFVELLEPEDRRPQESAFRRALCGRHSPFRSEGRLARADGRLAWVRITAAPIVDELGEPRQLLAQIEELRAQGSPEEQVSERLDELTGLLNPDAFADAMAPIRDRVRRTDTPAALYVAQIEADLGGTYSLEQDREIQRVIAERLRSVLRVDDVVGRLSDNEFAFMAEEISTTDAQSLAARIAEALSATHNLDGREVALRVALGAAMLDRRELNPEELLHRARRAAHRSGRRSGSELLYTSYEIDADPADDRPEGIDLSDVQVYRHRRG